MTERFQTDHRELDDLFDRYRAAPKGHVFAPLADACRKAGMLEEALEICARGVGEHPRYASGYVVQGKCLYDSGRVKDAQAAFDRVLELDPKNLVALKFLGIIHAERGDPARAHEYFEHILALDPSDREIRSRIEDVQPQKSAHAPEVQSVMTILKEVEAEEAKETDEEALTLQDVDDEAFEGEAITLRDETVTSDEIATMTLADIYAAQGYTERALKIYREVYKRQADNKTLALKIDALEKELASARAAETAAAPAPPEPTPSSSVATPASASPAAAAPANVREEEPARVGPAAIPTGSPIDQTRSYEQFKRWLKTSSR
jgi:tetratricopeptide (TPR) repeat protein